MAATPDLHAQTSPAESSRRTWWKEYAPLIFALIVAAVLRFAALEQKPLWYDELATLQRLSLSFTDHVRSMQGNHPLFELGLRFWMPQDGSDAWMRIPSAGFGVAAVWLTWLLLRAAGRTEAALAAWLMALSPIHLMYSRIARAYSLACMLALLSNLSLVWAIRRRRPGPFIAYALVTALMIYANLLAGSLWIAQGVFLLWFHRKRLRRLMPWIAAHAAVGLLILPWALYSFAGALSWGRETIYLAQQLGRFFKIAYVAMALSIGETVHPLNFKIAPLALIAFALAMMLGLIVALTRRKSMSVFLLFQAVLGFGVAVYFGAAAPKHLIVLLPAAFGLMAIGLVRWRRPALRAICVATLVLTMGASTVNYFTDREFTDADMVTPWRTITAQINSNKAEDDAVIIGYRSDQDTFRMCRHYAPDTWREDLEYLDFADWEGHLTRAVETHGGVWLLLHKADPWRDVEQWLAAPLRRWGFIVTPYQDEEHTSKGLQQWRVARGDHPSVIAWLGAMPEYAAKYHSPLYRLYHIQPGSREQP